MITTGRNIFLPFFQKDTIVFQKEIKQSKKCYVLKKKSSFAHQKKKKISQITDIIRLPAGSIFFKGVIQEVIVHLYLRGALMR